MNPTTPSPLSRVRKKPTTRSMERVPPTATARGAITKERDAAHLQDYGRELLRAIDTGRAPPINPPTWEWYIPIYFWLGGIAAGSWVVATADELVGRRSPRLRRAARYVVLGTIGAGTGLLIEDLGRADRFLHMLRIVRMRSTMNLGAWGLTKFGGLAGVAATLQAAQDGAFGGRIRRVVHRRRWLNPLMQLAGLPAALFVGSYTGVLLGTTSVPAWKTRARLLGPLFLSSGVSSGAAALALAGEVRGWMTPALRGRLSRIEAVALASELALTVAGRRATRTLPSARREPFWTRAIRIAMLLGGMAAPLAMQLRVLADASDAPDADEGPGGWGLFLPSLLSLAGGLTLRFLTTHEGRRSAITTGDTWAYAGNSARSRVRRPRPRVRGVRPNADD